MGLFTYKVPYFSLDRSFDDVRSRVNLGRATIGRGIRFPLSIPGEFSWIRESPGGIWLGVWLGVWLGIWADVAIGLG